MNLAHIKCLSMLLGALCAVQTVCLSKLAAAFDNKASRESSFRRIQRFMAQMVLDLDAVARYQKSRIPFDGPYTLTMDRTNWKFGEVNINVLVLGISYDHMSFPILFRLLPKRGNSNCRERINIMERFIRLFGCDSIKCLVADREFVGNEWFKWLNDNTIQYHIRIRDNFWVEDPEQVKRYGRSISLPISNTGKNVSCTASIVSVANSAILPAPSLKTRPGGPNRRSSYPSAARKKHFLLTRKDGPLKRCSRA